MQEAIRHGGRAEKRPSREQIQPAARALVERHSVQLFATARRYSLSAEDAEDAYQRGLEILLTKAPSAAEEDLVPWLKTVVKHEAFAIRRQRQRAELAGEPELAGGQAPPTHEQAERYERLRVGIEAMSRLKPQELRCLLLRADGYSYKQICDETGWTYTKVNRCVSEGRKAFLARVAGIESGAECERMAPLLSRLVDGEATVEDLAALRPHLRSCLSCRATLRDYRDAPARVAAFAPFLVTPGLLGRALHRLERLFSFAGAHKTAAVLGMAAALAGGGAAVRHAARHSSERPPAVHHLRPAVVQYARRPAARPAAQVVAAESSRPKRHRHRRRAHPHRPAGVSSAIQSQLTPAAAPVTAPPPQPAAPKRARAGGGPEFGP